MSENSEPSAPGLMSSAATPPIVLHTPIDVRSTSLAVLALLAVIALLYVAKAVFIPITVAVLVSYALTPVITWLKRTARLPTPVGAALTLCLIMGALGFAITSLEPATVQILDLVPRAAAKVSAALQRSNLQPPGALDKMKTAANEIQKAANAAGAVGSSGRQTPSPAARAPADAPSFNIRDYVLMGTASALGGVGQVVVVVALVYFLLVAGDSFRRSLVRISGETLSTKKVTVQILNEIDSQVRRYLLVQVLTSALMGIVAWALFASIGLEDALFWACAAGVLHFIPYAGPTVFVLLIALVAYVQFDGLQPVAITVGGTIGAIGVIGLLLVPWLTQKVGRLNAVTVFVALLFWGWLWGVWGLLLGVPIVMAINAVCERIDGLQPISEFLGQAPATLRESATTT